MDRKADTGKRPERTPETAPRRAGAKRAAEGAAEGAAARKGARREDGFLVPRVPLLIGFLTVVFMVGGFVLWATRTEIAGAVIAPGRIIVERNRQAIQHPDGGVVEEIRVKEGDAVREGDLLLRLDSTQLASELAIVESQLYEIMARRGRLEAEREGAPAISFDPALVARAGSDPMVAAQMKGQERLFRARRDSLDREIEQLRAQKEQLKKQIVGIEAQMAATRRQQELIGRELANQQVLLDKGLAQQSRITALQREEARLAGTLGNLQSRRAEAEQRIAELEIAELRQRARFREDAIAELRDLQYNEARLREQQRALKTRLDRLEIRAPISGVVYDLRVLGRRSVIRPAEPVLFLVPQDRPLIIEARVPVINVDEVSPNQKVSLNFSAFNSRALLQMEGTVTRVSPDAFTDPQTGQSWYRAEIQLPKEELAKLPEGETLVPGMPVEAFIRTRDRTPMAYLVKPLATYFNRAFRS